MDFDVSFFHVRFAVWLHGVHGSRSRWCRDAVRWALIEFHDRWWMEPGWRHGAGIEARLSARLINATASHPRHAGHPSLTESFILNSSTFFNSNLIHSLLHIPPHHHHTAPSCPQFPTRHFAPRAYKRREYPQIQSNLTIPINNRSVPIPSPHFADITSGGCSITRR